MSADPAYPSVADAMAAVRTGLRFLAAADATQMSVQSQAECLQDLERADAISMAVRASVLSAFTAAQGYHGDADYSARAWLVHRTRVTPGAASGHTAWARRFLTHPKVVAALAAGEVSESVGRVICRWTGVNLLPERAGQPVKIWAHISLADLLRLDGSSALQEEWTAELRARWAAHRAAAGEGAGLEGAWLNGDAADGGGQPDRTVPQGLAVIVVAGLGADLLVHGGEQGGQVLKP